MLRGRRVSLKLPFLSRQGMKQFFEKPRGIRYASSAREKKVRSFRSEFFALVRWNARAKPVALSSLTLFSTTTQHHAYTEISRRSYYQREEIGSCILRVSFCITRDGWWLNFNSALPRLAFFTRHADDCDSASLNRMKWFI